MKECQNIIDRALGTKHLDRYGPGKGRRNDILVIRAGEAGKSGSLYAKRYAEENYLYVRSVVDLNGVIDHLNQNSSQYVGAVVVDDFIGTGRSMDVFLDEIVIVLRTAGFDFPIFAVALLAFDRGVEFVERGIKKRGNQDVRLIVGRTLYDDDRAFSSTSKVFPDAFDRDSARALALDLGTRLVSKDPLGYDDMEALVAFEDNIPNDSLPILWASDQNWVPLFRRL